MQVFKFGGTSVGSVAAIGAAIEHVRAAGPRVAVVVSAMSGITDLLLEAVESAHRGKASEAAAASAQFKKRHLETTDALLKSSDRAARIQRIIDQATDELTAICRSITVLGELTTHTRDVAVSRGERVLAPLFAEALAERGLDARYIDAAELIFAAPRLGTVWPDFEKCQAAVDAKLRPVVDGGTIPVVPGFLGTGPQGELLTLGRGGTDLSAALLGRALNADRVVLWKEVDGLMTADPKSVPGARVLSALHTREAAELAFYGAKILHPKTLYPLFDRPIPLFIRNTFEAKAPGTRIASDVPPGAYPVKALSAVNGQALLALSGKGMMGVPGVAGRAFSALSEAGHSAAMISQGSSESSICFVVPGAEAAHAAAAVREAFRTEFAAGLIDEIRIEPQIALVAVVGLGMRGQPGIAARTFGALGRAKINVVAIAQGSSELNITAAVLESDVKAALAALHAEFQLDKEHPLGDAQEHDAQVALLGFGQIGRALAQQLTAQAEYFQRDLGVQLRCVAVADRSGATIAEAGFAAAALAALVEAKSKGQPIATGGQKLGTADLAARLSKELFALPFARPILVDLTAEETAPLLKIALTQGFHVVLANKKPLTVPQAEYDALFATAREKKRSLRYEATVGAGLPILDTLAKLKAAGDEVHSLLGCFSGTLGYLLTQLEAGVRFADALAAAKALGYTEPDPREDLLGRDVARKALILARTLGRRLDLADIQLEPVIPAALASVSPEAFQRELQTLSVEFAARAAAAQRQGQVLRYVVRIDATAVRVALEAVEAASPLGRLRGTDNQVVIHTKRYAENPLVVTGPGAGADVTAAGVLNDLVAIATEKAKV